MIFISHRGNLYGKNTETENSVFSIDTALSLGFDVEIDIWFKDNKFYLGHNRPRHSIEKEYLVNPKIWCHLKNKEAILAIKDLNMDIHYFWHEQDKYTITSKGYIWSYIDMPISKYSICVLPEKTQEILENIKHSLGICSDEIAIYREKI
jgi:hypothetical protein